MSFRTANGRADGEQSNREIQRSPHTPTTTTSLPSSPDAHHAVSVEGAIDQLLQEKMSLQTQNAQLWRLVDKQRAMILGLQKDLEKATARAVKLVATSAIRHESEAEKAGNRNNGASASMPSTPTVDKQGLEVPTGSPGVIAGSPKTHLIPSVASSVISTQHDGSTRPPQEHARGIDLAIQTVENDIAPKLVSRHSDSVLTSSSIIALTPVGKNPAETTGAPMSPALSVRMQQIARGPGSPRISSATTQQFEEGAERASYPRRERVRTSSQRSIGSAASNTIPEPSTQKSAEPSDSGATTPNNRQVRPRSSTTNVSVSHTPNTSARNSTRLANGDIGGSLADITDPYYSSSLTFLPLPAKSEKRNSYSRPPTPLYSSTMTSDHPSRSRSPESLYDDASPHKARLHKARSADRLIRNSGDLNLEPAAEFYISPESTIWQETSPVRKGQLDNSLTTSPSATTRVSHTAGREVRQHERSGKLHRGELTPDDLATVQIHLMNSKVIGDTTTNTVQPWVTIGIFRDDAQLLHKIQKSHQALGDLEDNLETRFSLSFPGRAAFESSNPSVITSRRATVDLWFQKAQAQLVTQPRSESARIFCQFLSTDIVLETSAIPTCEGISDADLSPLTRSDSMSSVTTTSNQYTTMTSFSTKGSHKEGFLSKRGKNFGGWKSRYFVLDGPTIRYYEAPGAAHLGTITLSQAQIGRQQAQGEFGTSDKSGDTYHHAFLILEPKKRNTHTYVRHVLCAHDDEERDDWIRALLPFVGTDMPLPQEAVKQDKRDEKREKARSAKNLYANEAPANDLESFAAIGYGETIAGQKPVFNTSDARSLSPRIPRSDADNTRNISISGPMSGGPIDDASVWGQYGPSSPAMPAVEKKKKKFWAFGKNDKNLDIVTPSTRESSTVISPSAHEMTFATQSSQLFGAPLAEAVQMTTGTVPIAVPSIVYRCIEYLDLKHAEGEEGIYRLSGSNTVIKALKDRFNNDRSFNLSISDEYFDVHAIAGLLKLYLRELPSSILTRDLQRDFLDISEMPEGQARMITLRTIVHSLPSDNFELLKILSRHLRNVVNHSDTNKMSLRNVGIVFSPTLNIPASVFSLFIAEYETIFGLAEGEGYTTQSQDHIRTSSAREEVRGKSASNDGYDAHSGEMASPIAEYAAYGFHSQFQFEEPLPEAQ